MHEIIGSCEYSFVMPKPVKKICGKTTNRMYGTFCEEQFLNYYLHLAETY